MTRSDRPGIGLDVDGVLAEFNRPMLDALNAYNRQQGRVVVEPTQLDDMFTAWDWGIQWFGLQAWMETFEARDYAWWRNLPTLLTPDEWGRLRRLVEQHRVYFISHRPPEIQQATAQWLVRHLNLPATNFTTLHTAHKGTVAHACELGVLVDDKPENLVDVTRHAPLCETWLLCQPWNRDWHTHETFTRHKTTFGAVLAELEGVYGD